MIKANQPEPTSEHEQVTAPPRSGSSAEHSRRVQRAGFLQIRVEGSPREMGLQHGELLRDEIRNLIDAVHHHILSGQPGVVGWGLRRAARAVTALMATQIPRRYRQEIAGIARAADVSYRDLLLVNCVDDVLAILRPLGAMVGRLGCSAFAVSPDRTATGELICGRNLDYFVTSAVGDDVWAATTYMKEHVVVVEYAPADGARFVSVAWPGFVGAATALSDRGILLAALVVATIRNQPLATPCPFLYRRIMEEARTLEEAVTILRRARRTQGHNVLLGSGDEGAVAVVEFTPWRFAVRHAEDGWVGATNHFNAAELVRHHANLAFPSSIERLARLEELCTVENRTDRDARTLARLLVDTRTRSPALNEYCTIWNPCTIYSTLFAPAQRRLWLRVADGPDRGFEEIALASDPPLL
ncbi:MAG: hypothetical protein GEU73_15855 [Chloroflexi bacterium]|nr:hypothetical protein [Chloroflexota bacterium]